MRLSWLAAGVATAGILAGCSSQPPAEKPSTAETTAETDAPTGHGSLAQCLSDHGVPAAPGPGGGPPPGVDANTWQQAMQSCASLAPGPAG
ncbi:hypothetical protein H7J93_27075 [Mycobacterium barrassiae]|uniref:hypothetical protein n=1 Tax=Mycobacterium barrassiae TaxID=319709 RepID=UPI002265B8BE|nr:hypothetical protein [Mycobacterium barrassiae]MCV7303292.1 hypothetical protein [Mycobacterium barrassiae]